MIRAIIAFLASLLTGTQAFLLVVGRDGICLNEGCEIVDSFPKLPPLYFNIAGSLFFLILFWCFLKGRRGSEYWHHFACQLLLAGLAAEAVLLFFQYSIVTAFCSYCLIIFSIILLLNLLCGLRQIFTSVIIFIAVFSMLSSLELRGAPSSDRSLDAGSYARIGEGSEGTELYLFFSESCEHCENVIATIGEDYKCDIRFNPIENIDRFSLPGVTRFSDYDPRVNALFLKNLGIKEIPVLVVKEQGEILVLKGEGRIENYLNDSCTTSEVMTYNETSQTTEAGYGYISAPTELEEGCSVESDCEDVIKEQKPE